MCKDQEVLVSIMQRFLKIAGGANVADLFASIKFHQWISGFKSRVQKMHQQADTIMSNIIGEHRKCKAAKCEEEDIVDVFPALYPHSPITIENIKSALFVTCLVDK